MMSKMAENGRQREIQNHGFGHNLSSNTVSVTILVSIPMFLGMRNPMVPIKYAYAAGYDAVPL